MPRHPDIISAGLTDYGKVLEFQRKRREDVISGKENEIILLTEHHPVYTLGRHGREENLKSLPAETECVRIERGGDVTYHAPGQLVVYPIISLWNRNMGVKDYVRCLERWVIDVLGIYGIRGATNPDAPGVWLDLGKERERKICALGISVRRGVTIHGFALNANIDLRGFANINPCGFVDKGVTSLSAELGYKIEMSDLERKMISMVPDPLISPVPLPSPEKA